MDESKKKEKKEIFSIFLIYQNREKKKLEKIEKSPPYHPIPSFSNIYPLKFVTCRKIDNIKAQTELHTATYT